MPSVAFTTLGCKVNQFETEVIEGLFKQRGYEVVDFNAPSDIYVINTCSVTHLGERKSRQLIRRACRINPQATVVVTGCYAQVSPEEVAAIEDVDVVIGTQDRGRIVELTEAALKEHRKISAVSDIMSAGQFEDIPLFTAPGRTRAFLKIQEGCTNFCTYCIIPYARGPLRSRPLASIVAEAKKLVDAGFKEIVLTGIHLGTYGRESSWGLNLTDVIKSLLAETGILRLRLSSLESIEVDEELIAIMQADDRLCPHLHLPLQAGDDDILKSMNRHYTVDEYRRLITGIRAKVPDIAVSTDIIVGFPGESQARFENTMAFVAEMGFARVHVFPYSRRSGTPAADFPGQIAEQDKKRRVNELQGLAEHHSKKFQQRFVGRQFAVLWETENQGIVDGLTGNYIRVYADGDGLMPGSLNPVRLDKPYKDGLWGDTKW